MKYKLRYIGLIILILLLPKTISLAFDPEPPSQFNVTEDDYFNYTFNATGEVLKYEATIPYTGWPFVMDSETGFYEGTPQNSDVGIHNVTIVVTELYETYNQTTREIVFNITNINDPPRIIEYWPGNISINETDSLEIGINYTDNDPTNDSMHIYWYHDGILVNTTSNLIAVNTRSYIANYTLDTNYSSAGHHHISVNVTDEHSAQMTKSWNISVKDVDRPPQIDSSYPETKELAINETETIEFHATFHDPDEDSINATWYINGSRTKTDNETKASNFTFETDYTSAGTYNITLLLSSHEQTKHLNWTVNVHNRNVAPSIVFQDESKSQITDLTSTEGERLDVFVNASDIDKNMDTLIIRINGTINQTNDTLSSESSLVPFSLELGYDDAGTYNISASVNDTKGLSNNSNFILEVEPNVAPEITDVIQVEQAAENETINLGFNATDSNDNLHKAVIFLDGKKIYNTSITQECTFEYRFNFTSAGTHNITYFINDTGGENDTISFEINVNDTDRHPQITYAFPFDNHIDYAEPQEVFFEINFSDPDGDPIDSVQWFNNGTLEKIDDSNNSNYSFDGDFGTHGNYNITAIGGNDLNTSHSWHLEIKKTYRPPNITQVSHPLNITINESENVTLMINMTHPDNDTIGLIQWKINGSNITEEKQKPSTYSTNYTFITNYTSSGVHDITMVAYTSENNKSINTTLSFNITVLNLDASPNIDSIRLNESVIEGEIIMFSVNASDPDCDLQTLRLYRNDTILNESKVTDCSHTISARWQTNLSSAGNYSMKAFVNDSLGHVKESVSNITIEKNEPPTISNESYPPEIEEGQTFTFNATVRDSNNNIKNVSFYKDDDMIDNITRSDSFNYSVEVDTTFNESSTINLTLVVLDRSGARVSKNYSLVTSKNVKPVIQDYTAATEYEENQTANLFFNATDQNDNIHCLSIWINSSLYNMNCSKEEINVDFYFNFSMAGIWNLTYLVNDTGGLTDKIETSIQVNNTDRAPYFTDFYPVGDIVVNHSDTLYFNASYTDPDNEPLLGRWYIDDDKLAETSNENFSEFIYDGNLTINATYNITFIINNSLEKNLSWDVAVIEGNNPPVINTTFPIEKNQTVQEGEFLNFNHTSYDLEGDDISYQWFLDEDLISTQQNISLFFNYSMQGNRTVTLILSDGLYESSTSWQVEVFNVNRVPKYAGKRSLFGEQDFVNGSLSNVNLTDNLTLARNGSTYYPEGTYTSGIFELPFSIQPAEYLAILDWQEIIPTNANITVYLRSGISSQINASWKPLQKDNGSIQKGRFLQIRINLSATDQTPVLDNLTLQTLIADKKITTFSFFNWIDLDDFFHDPDPEGLNYTVHGDVNINVTIDEYNRVHIRESNSYFNGTENIVFTASDGYASINSTNVSIIVDNPIYNRVAEPEPIIEERTVYETKTETQEVIKKETEEKTVSSYLALDLITPPFIEINTNKTLQATFRIENSWNKTIKNITIMTSARVNHSLKTNFIESLAPNESANITIEVPALSQEGQFNINITVQSNDPTITQEGAIPITTINRNTKSGESARARLQYVDEYLSLNPACLELSGQVANARERLEEGMDEQAEQILDDTLKACKRMQGPLNLTQEKEDRDPYLHIILTLLIALVIIGLFGKVLTGIQKKRYMNKQKKQSTEE
ncbi:MAG: hypothetical protein ACLFP2_01485 [Candidatus Woesearchaeota archaeon]